MNTQITRRAVLRHGAIAAGALITGAGMARYAAAGQRRLSFTMDLRGGSIGVRAGQVESIELAHRHGFQSVTPIPEYLAGLSDDALSQLLADLEGKKLAWGAAGLSVEFRRDEATFAEGIKQLPRLAEAMRRSGITRVGTWIRPFHDELTYLANFRQHAARLRACARILADCGVRFGLEYVGPKTSWSSARHGFIHTMAETRELIAEIGEPNVGYVLDSWHWYTAHETVKDLRTLTSGDVVACDLNDAPAGVAIDEQIDNRRELPAATGVIDLKAFLGVLVEIGYDGPVRAEPFNQPLNALDDEAAVAATAAAMRRAFSLVTPPGE